MIDWHCHILPGIDDGPATMDESVEMVRGLRRAGYTAIHCTPHLIRGYCQAANADVLRGVQRLQEQVDRDGGGIRLMPGREYCLDEFLLDYLKEPLPLGDTKYLLIEVPGHASPAHVKETCYRIRCSGYVPMIAHPERCSLFELSEHRVTLFSKFTVFKSKLKTKNSELEANHLITYLQEIGCAFQGNLGSFAGRYGQRVRHAVVRLREAGVYTHFGSDAHSPEHIHDL